MPAGRTLRPSEGLTVTKDATVLEGLHIQGRVTIAADDVILRESLVQTDTSTYPIHVTDDATGVLIEDVEVDNLGGTGIGILISSGSTATIRRADIHSAEDGIRIQGDDVTIEDSYVHDLQRQSGGHHDTIQIRSGDNVTLEGNTLLPYDESTGDPMNAALQIGSLLGDDRISNLRVIDNYMNGGNYTINGGSEGIVDSAFYSGNRFGRDYRYGVVGNMDAASTWDDSNVFDDTGDPAR
ncbi:right-handed parallel beta-helix repeat-containing protein [Nocardioides xinjiangensis]|uniref:right-handed parallel beta-helix repeat-containing protein n=1 Tax=Nocardioides xinjiangensis TaxID=2817376 RepID=UPI001B313064|nr:MULTISPECIES: right-handed parallel beta-helix repeat-containing protein [unclassified Nocardioides]